MFLIGGGIQAQVHKMDKSTICHLPYLPISPSILCVFTQTYVFPALSADENV